MSNDLVLDPAASVSGSPALSQVERVVDTFVAPTKTFTDILRSASWWLPCVLMILGSVATAFVVDKQVGFDRVYQNQVHASPVAEERYNQMTTPQRDMAVKFTKGISYAVPVIILITFAIYSLILWGCFNFILGAQTTFGQVFATCFYAALPYLLLNVLVIALVYFGGNAESYDYKYPAGTNLGYYLPDVAPWLRALLGRLDLIQLWSVALTAVGMSVISRKSLMQSALVVCGLWFIMTIVTAAGAAFGG